MKMKMKTIKREPGDHYLEMRTNDFKVQINEVENDGKSLFGYAAKFNVSSNLIGGWFTESIRTGAFDGVLDSDVRVLFNHDPSQLLGRVRSQTAKIWVDDTGLAFEVILPQCRHDIMELVERGDLSGNSFRFGDVTDDWTQRDENTAHREIITIGRMPEISLATFPVYPDTELDARAEQHYQDLKTRIMVPVVPPDPKYAKESRARKLYLNIKKYH